MTAPPPPPHPNRNHLVEPERPRSLFGGVMSRHFLLRNDRCEVLNNSHKMSGFGFRGLHRLQRCGCFGVSANPVDAILRINLKRVWHSLDTSPISQSTGRA
jgi:hypothetical protein